MPIVQYGATRSGSTFQFIVLCLAARLAMRRLGASSARALEKVRCLYDDGATAAWHDSAPVVIKTHSSPRMACTRRPCLVFTSIGSTSRQAVKWHRPAYQQVAEDLRIRPLAEVAAYRTFFNLSDGELTAMQAYLRYWMVLRQCCGSQMSVQQRLLLHGCAQHTNIAMDADSLGWPACEMYSLKQVTRRLSRTSLFPLIGIGFVQAIDQLPWAMGGTMVNTTHAAAQMASYCKREHHAIVRGQDFNGQAFDGCDNLRKFPIGRPRTGKGDPAPTAATKNLWPTMRSSASEPFHPARSGSGGYGSQVGQDNAVLRLFADPTRRHARPTRFFVDIAANSPLLFSNTVRLEDTGAWRGLCIDASRQFKTAFRTFARSCEFVEAAMGEPGSTVIFRELRTHRARAEHAWLHGVSGIVPTRDAPTTWGGEGNVTASLSVAQLRAMDVDVRHHRIAATSLTRVLDANRAPFVIDYLSLDVEGVEETVLRGLFGSRYTMAVLTIERPTSACKAILRRAGMRFKASLGRFGEELWVNDALLAARVAENRRPPPPAASVPATLQFTCQRDVHAGGLCLHGACPHKNVEAERCRAMCAHKRACGSFMHNRYGECYLKTNELTTRADLATHGTVACAKLNAAAADWRRSTWPFSGFYRLGDSFWCSPLRQPQLNRQEFYCGGLDAVNVRRQWPGSLIDKYAQLASKLAERHQRRLAPRIALLANIIGNSTLAADACGEPHPSPSSCVFHVRLGDVFRDCTGGAGDCTNRTAAELWEAQGRSWRATIGERKIRTRTHFEQALNNLPKRIDTVVIVGAALVAGPSKESDYVELLAAFLESRGMRVQRRVQTRVAVDGFDHAKTDCEILHMTAATCYLPSAGGFSNVVGRLVKHRGGTVLLGAGTLGEGLLGEEI